LIIYIKKILFGISLVAALMVVATPAYAQTGEVTNSKYLEIMEHKYRVGESSDTITGTVKNISTEEASSITIYLLLYDKANQLITIETGYADVTPLPSQDTSPFSINVYYQGNDMNHYVMLPGGRP
jgi:prophage DNA circulation protein